MLERLDTDAAKAVRFLLWLNPGAQLYLEAHESAGEARPKWKTYPAHAADAAQRFVSTNNSGEWKRNAYFLPNAEFLTDRRATRNIAASRFLWADLDCKDYPGSEDEQRDTILGMLSDDKLRPKGVPKPTAFWFTGGGYQAVWRMAEPIDAADAEAMNRALLVAFQAGSGPIDVGRLLRLPETVNWLSDTKRGKGREPAKALLLDPVGFGAAPASYALSDFNLRLPKAQSVAVLPQGGALPDIADLEPLPLPDDLGTILPLDPDWAAVIVDGRDPPDRTFKSRSERMFAATIWMLGHKVQPGHVLSIITCPDLAISAHNLESPNPLRYARRQIVRAMAVIEAKRGGWPVRDKYDQPVPNAPLNIRFALMTLGIEARRNLFTQSDEFTGLDLDTRDIAEIGDILCSTFTHKLGFTASVAAIKRELVTIAHEQSYHPVRDYLDGLAWDGRPRLDTWLSTYCGADDTPLNREFGARFLIAGVRRIRQPGVKFDTMLVLEGSQGTGKSSLAARLAVREDWYCGSLDLNADAKTKAEMLARAWIVECQELDGARKATLDAVKKFLSTPTDTYRRSYNHNAGHYPRHCVIIGTTNEDAYLRDTTGNRRFWPVRVGTIDLKRFAADVDQLWAEAAAREQAGESIILSPDLWGAAAELQEGRMVEDPFAHVLEGAFAEITGRVSMESVKLILNLDPGRMYAGEAQRLRAGMAALGWEYGTHRLRDLGGTRRTQRKGFARGSIDEQKTEWIARRGEGGIVTMVEAGADPGGETPF